MVSSFTAWKRKVELVAREIQAVRSLFGTVLAVAMHKQTLFRLAAILALSNLTAAAEPRPITQADNVLAIYAEDWGLASRGQPKLIFCAWDDGLLVWSTDRLNGGPPYRTAQISPDDFVLTLRHIHESGAFDLPQLKRARFGPDSQFTTILVRQNSKELKMSSWHELYQAGGKSIATDHGITALEKRKPLQVLTTQSAEYLHYRMAWSELRLSAANLIPAEGSESAGSAKKLEGELSWQTKSK